MENFKEINICVIDSGMFMPLAIKLSEYFGKVFYFTEWRDDYPLSKDDRIGENVPGLIRVSSLLEVVDDFKKEYNVELYVFPGIYYGDYQNHLVKLGKRVWGSRKGDELERFRLQANEEFKKLGLPRPTMVPIVGMEALRKHLKPLEDKWIKISNYRGNFETKHFENSDLIKRWLKEKSAEFGDEEEVMEFLVEDGIDGEEFGYDGYCIDGQYPSKTTFGLEIKDCGYCCHVKDYKDISPLITDFNDKITGLMKQYQYRNFMSTEIRIGKDKIPYMIDFTARIPSPPGELFIEMVDNLAEIMWYGAAGVLIEPVFNCKYGIEVMINSEAASNSWLNVEFPEEIRRWVKLRNLTIINDKYCIIPRYNDFQNIGAVIATGDSIDECVEKVNSYAEQIKGEGVDVKLSSINEMQDVIKKGEALGIKF